MEFFGDTYLIRLLKSNLIKTAWKTIPGKISFLTGDYRHFPAKTKSSSQNTSVKKKPCIQVAATISEKQ